MSDARILIGDCRDLLGRFLPGTHWRPHKEFRERAYLEREYSAKGRSAKDIAVEHSVTENAILSWLARHGIPWRPVEPGTFPLADGIPARMVRLRAYGNAICIPVAVEFIRSVMA